MPKAERPFPSARDFDLSQSIRVKSDFNLNEEIPPSFRRLVDFLNQQPGWAMDVGKTMAVLYEESDFHFGTAIRLSWFGEEKRISLDLIPRRTETMEFARRVLGEAVPGQAHMYRVHKVDITEGPIPAVSFESLNDSSGTITTRVDLDLDSGSVLKEERYAPGKK